MVLGKELDVLFTTPTESDRLGRSASHSIDECVPNVADPLRDEQNGEVSHVEATRNSWWWLTHSLCNPRLDITRLLHGPANRERDLMSYDAHR